MAIKKYTLEVTQTITVELDGEKLNDQFNKEFSRHFYPMDSLDDHAKHLAHLEACGMISLSVEGYGDLAAMNIKTGGYRDTDVKILSTE